MTKRELKHRIGKLEKSLKASAVQGIAIHQENRKLTEDNKKLKRAVLKVDYKNRRLKARLEQATVQIEAMGELCVLWRSEVWSYLHATQLRGGTAALKLKELEAVMPNAGKPFVYEDEQEQSRKSKRFGLNGNGEGEEHRITKRNGQ